MLFHWVSNPLAWTTGEFTRNWHDEAVDGKGLLHITGMGMKAQQLKVIKMHAFLIFFDASDFPNHED